MSPASWNPDSGVQELTALSPLLHYVNCGLPLIRSVCGGEVLDVVRPMSLQMQSPHHLPCALPAALLRVQHVLQQHLGIASSSLGPWKEGGR